MAILDSNAPKVGADIKRNRESMKGLVDQVRALEQRTADRSARAAKRFHEHGKLPPRERLAHLIVPGSPFVELMALAGYCGIEDPDPAISTPGAALIAGIGCVSGVRCMIAINDAGISTPAASSWMMG